MSGTPATTSFTYDGTYPDRLTACGGTTVSYNSMGCPTTVNGYTATWTRGKLAKLSKGNRIAGTSTYQYGYNALGQRISSSYTFMHGTGSSSAIAMGTLTNYNKTFRYDQSGRLISEETTNRYYGEDSISEKIMFLYDESGIIGMTLEGTSAAGAYYFQRNLLGDVIAIYDTNGTKVGGYAYDAWGNCTITLNSNGVAIRNPIRYRGYYYDQDTGLYFLNARYYSPAWRRFISPDDTGYLDPESVNGLNLYTYCNNDPVNYADPSGHMPEWAQWVVCGLAIAGLIVATVLTCGVAGAGAAAVGAAMLAGGLISGGITIIDQLHDTGTIDWTSVAISVLSGTAYGLVLGLTGGTGAWAVAGKFAVAGGTSLLNSWNEWDENSTFGGMMFSLAKSLAVSGIAQGAGYLAGKFGPQILSKFLPRNSNEFITMGDIGSALWSIPAVKAGGIRFISGTFGSIVNDF